MGRVSDSKPITTSHRAIKSFHHTSSLPPLQHKAHCSRLNIKQTTTYPTRKPLPDRGVYPKLPRRVQHPKHVQQAVRQLVRPTRGQCGIPQRLDKRGCHVIGRDPKRNHCVHGDQANALIGDQARLQTGAVQGVAQAVVLHALSCSKRVSGFSLDGLVIDLVRNRPC
jgi:hypothetical protein